MRGVCANTVILQCPRQVCKESGSKSERKLNRLNEGEKTTEVYLTITKRKKGITSKQIHFSTLSPLSLSENTEAAFYLSLGLHRMHVVAIYRSRKKISF